MTPFLAAIEPVRLVTDQPEPAFAASFWIGAIALAAASLIIGAAVSWWAWRDRRRAEPGERAFRALALRLRLSPRSWAALRRLSRRSGVPAAALLLSEHAFTRAASNAPEPALQHLHRRLFPSR